MLLLSWPRQIGPTPARKWPTMAHSRPCAYLRSRGPFLLPRGVEPRRMPWHEFEASFAHAKPRLVVSRPVNLAVSARLMTALESRPTAGSTAAAATGTR